MSDSPRGYTSLRGETAQIASLAAPVAIWNLGLMLMGFVDVFWVARLEDSAQLAAVSLGHIYSFSVLVFGQGLLRGFDPFLAQAHGAGERARLAEHLARAILFTLVLTLPTIALHWLAGPLLQLFDQPEAIVPITVAYCESLIWGLAPALLFVALGQFFQNLGRALLPMVAILIANVLNLVLDRMFVLGFEPWHIPSFGAVGCGHATSIGRWVMCLVLVAFGWRSLKQYRPARLGDVFDWQMNMRVLRTGLPVGAQACLEGWAFSALGLMMGWLGKAELAAHAVVINLAAMTYMVPAGIGAAASIRVGHLIGLGDARWPTSAWLSIAFSVCWMTCTGLFFWLAREPLAAYYSVEQSVRLTIIALLPVAAGFQIFDGIQATAFGALRGAGDTTFPAAANMIGYWIIGLPAGYLFGVHFGFGAVALWGSVALALMIISFLVLGRLFVLVRRGVERV